MKTEYAVFNPATGLYDRANTQEEAVVITARIAADFYFSHAHNSPVAVVQIDESGAEMWTAPDGSHVVSPAEIAAQIEALEKHRLSFENAVAIPTTVLGN